VIFDGALLPALYRSSGLRFGHPRPLSGDRGYAPGRAPPGARTSTIQAQHRSGKGRRSRTLWRSTPSRSFHVRKRSFPLGLVAEHHAPFAPPVPVRFDEQKIVIENVIQRRARIWLETRIPQPEPSLEHLNPPAGSVHSAGSRTRRSTCAHALAGRRGKGKSPVLGFEPRSEAPQASRIIQCSEAGRTTPFRSYPTRAPRLSPSSAAPNGARYKSRQTAAPRLRTSY